MCSLLDNYSNFKSTQFSDEITNEKFEAIEVELNDQITILQQEIACKSTYISELENTKEWKRYFHFLRHRDWYYWIFYILFVLLTYFLSKQGAYPMDWLPPFFVLDFSDVLQVLWKSVLFGVVSLFLIWRLLSFEKIITAIPRIMARKQLKEIDRLKKEKEKLLSQQNEYKQKLDVIFKYKALLSEKPTEDVIMNLKSRLNCLKDGPKSDTMYRDCYSWVEFLYDVDCPNAEEYEYVVLKCEEAVWLTPKERQAYCIRRMGEIEKSAREKGKVYSGSEYRMKYHYSGLSGIDPSVKTEETEPDFVVVPRIDVSDM